MDCDAMVLIILALTAIIYVRFRNDETNSAKYADDPDFCQVHDDCVVDCGGAVNKIYLKNIRAKLKIPAPPL